MTAIHFEAWTGHHPRLQCVWQDQLLFFPSEEAATAWARRQGLWAVFDTPEPRGIEYQFLDIPYEDER